MNFEKLIAFIKDNNKSVFIVLYILLLFNITYVFVKDELSRKNDKVKKINNISRVLKKIEELPDPSVHLERYIEAKNIINSLQSDSLTEEKLKQLKTEADELFERD